VTMPLIRTVNLAKTFPPSRSGSRSSAPITAFQDVNLEIRTGSTMALLGRSGSGKSTLALCLALFESPSSGEIYFEGVSTARIDSAALRMLRSQIQLIFQDPSSALNPRLTAIEVVAEPLTIAGVAKTERRDRALTIMERVGLASAAANRRSGQFSGGQKQRLAIARALILRPKLLILDEAFSALDLSLQVQMCDLLRTLQSERGLTYLHITHDFDFVERVADEVAVLSDGRIVDCGPTSRVLKNPAHVCTQQLIAATPRMPDWYVGSAAS
jgi:ABC-type glutathione transport system ATPase component